MRIDAGSNKVLVISESGPFMTVVMDESSNQTAIATLFSLEDRLRRLEWYLSGDDEVKDTLQRVIDQGKNNTVQARLGKLENDLDKLSTRSPIVYNLLKLHATYPDLFQPSTSGIPTSLSTAELLSIISSCATSYPTTASRLDAIKDLPIPSAESSASLIALLPRLAQVNMLQESQARQMAELRTRTASAIQRWYEIGVLGESECWAEWAGRVVDVEKTVRRAETHQAREEKEKEVYRPS